MEANTEFTISVFSENKVGLLNRVVSIFTRQFINIESLNTSESSIPDIFRYTIVIKSNLTQVRKVIGQLEKQIDVLKAFFHKNNEVVYQELALYKVPTSIFANGETVEQLVRDYNARILRIEPEYIIVEKTGHKEETNALLAELSKIGIYEFVRSGRVAVSKPMEQLNNYLNSLQANAKN